ncbi:LamB/YcsF family protein [Brachybacterium muris]|uniref:LamB/YcsF family protein n=1 Tax=Brachybacterium muris TaxID=219301 RepID=UPI0021A77040|nr:LamB/YcsF family protein [Brachybacterium muris]
MNRTATDTDVPASIDLNADLGEGLGVWPMGDDEAMLQVVATANIACGAHAGDPSTMRRACAGAARNDVAITAHVAYPDLLGFGRRFQDIAPGELTDQVIAQVGALRAIAAAEGTRVRGVKPHGALYNALAHHEVQAAAVLTALIELGIEGPLPLVAAPGAVVARLAADAGIPVVLEAFTDRAYTPDGTLVPRSVQGSVLTDPDQVVAQALSITREHRVRTLDGTWIPIRAGSLCLHGDTPGAVALAQRVRAALEAADVQVKAVL